MDDPNDSVGNCERSLGQMSFLPPVNFIPRFRPITRNPEHERIWKQGDAVIESFQRMVTKYDESADRRLENFRANHVKFTIDELTRNEATLNHLVSNLLPMLRSQIIRLLKSLNPFGLQQEPESKIRLISQNRLNVEKTIDILRAWIVKVCPGRLVKPYPSSDHHYKRSKSFRLFTLKKYIFEASLDIGRSCRVASELLHHAKCSADAHSQQTKKTYYQGLLAAKRAVGSIHAAIECIKGSELDVAEKSWQSRLTGIDYSMRIIMCLITPATNSSRRRKKFGDESADRIGDYIINDSLRSSAAALKARFDAPMVLLLLYLIPLIPDIATQNDYRDWLLTWNTQRNLACENYIDISRSLIDRESDGHESDDHESDSYHSSDSYESDYRF
ncbi:hypothetical protein PtA15_1A505 [Puccinia triticina]|uniref:BRO1 domain-containing protein n=1 Tax=Puccinia triticina TaxID=208348 RepID=A0ABY7C7N6_9BASI|nr:uncharacterized protein PtA15_1A505 [Puccinia triticina]WAQ81166.1 hypothetical protein PtA15_1A505 [Puccinia triticina]